MKLKIFALTILLASASFAQTTLCYKKGWKKLSQIEDTPLDGGICNSRYTLRDMKIAGYRVEDVKVTPTDNGIDYTYVLTNDKEIIAPEKALPSYNSEYFMMYDVSEDGAKISRGNLKVGQSGIVIHRYPNTLQSILANGVVVDSNNEYTTLKFEPFEDLKQNAIPTTKVKPAEKDIFALNYLYGNSILIAPNAESYRTVSSKFKDFNFIQLDIFAYYLKNHSEPLPSKEIIQEFARMQNLGTLFFNIENYVYIVDSRTFTILDKVFMFDSNTEENLPFYTRVEEIEDNFWDIDLDSLKKIIDPFGEKEKEKASTYSAYYKSVLGIE